MVAGIYKLNFNNTTKVYIGQSKDIEYRYNYHKTSLKRGGASKKLQQAYKDFGIPSLEILEEMPDKYSETFILEREINYIFKYDAVTNGFNSYRASGEVQSSLYESTTVGELNGNAAHSNEVYIQILKQLINYKKSYKQIAQLLNVSEAIVISIGKGIQHKWLAKELPKEYSIVEKIFKRNLRYS